MWLWISSLYAEVEIFLLTQRLAKFSYQGPNLKHFILCKWYSLCCTSSALPLYLKSSHRQCIKKWTWLCFNMSLFVHAEFWILCNFHLSQKKSSFWVFQLFKNTKLFLAHRVYNYSSCPMGWSSWTSILNEGLFYRDTESQSIGKGQQALMPCPDLM